MKLSPRYGPPPVLVVDGPADDQAVVVRRQRRRLESLLTELTDDEWRSPSRCDGWTVQDVDAHLVGVNAFWEASVAAGLAGTPTRVLATFDPAAHPPLMVAPMRSLTPREVLDQFVASNDGFLDVLVPLDHAGWSAPAETPVGHVPIQLLAQHALWDAWVHERDVALPLGRTSANEPDEVVSCLRYAAAVGPALVIGDPNAFSGELAVDATDPDVRFSLNVGDHVAVRDDAPRADTPSLRGPAVALVDALSLRTALPADAPVEWHAHLRGLAAMFDAEPPASA